MKYVIFAFLTWLGGTQAHAASPVTIAFYGDSTTYGSQLVNGRGQRTPLNEPAIVQSILRLYFGSDAIVVDNQGVGGTEASQLVNGTDGVHRPFAQEMADSTASIVVINFGLNDYYFNAKPTPGYISESVTDYWSYMASLCQIARNYGKICVYQEPNPVLGVGRPVTEPVNIYSFVYVLRQVAQQMNAPLVLQFDTYQQLPFWDTAWLTEDHTHPTDAGYAFKAMNTANVLRPIVASLL